MVFSTKRRWASLEVDLSRLVEQVVRFFESNGFNEITAFKTEAGYEVVAEDSKRYKVESGVSVVVEGSPNDFTVSLTSRAEKKPLPPLFLTTMLGGGYFLLKRFKSEEAMRKLERDFGEKIESMVLQTRAAH